MRNVKQIWTVVASYLLIGITVLLTSTAIADEPRDVSEKSKSYSSGRHFNRKTYGKDAVFFLDKEVLQAKKSSVTDLTVLEPCIGCFNDPADDSLPILGPIHMRYVYNATPEEFVTFDSEKLEGKEKVNAINITHLFRWLGKFCEASLVDINEDGEIVGYGFAFIIKF
jgi:hypothetical protein